MRRKVKRNEVVASLRQDNIVRIKPVRCEMNSGNKKLMLS